MDLVGIDASYIFRVGVDSDLKIDLDADANDCKYSVTVTVSPLSAQIIHDDIGEFVNHDQEFVRLWTKNYPPSLTVLTDIAVGDHDIIVDYLDSENTSRQETTKIIATDKCLTSGLTVPIADGDLDMVYIIESPMQFINFSGLMNDEC